jgi:prolyl oligopeptidase
VAYSPRLLAPVVGLLAVGLIFAERPPLPKTPRLPVTDVYHDVRVDDPYRWLENSDDPEVKKWVEEQNRHTRAVLGEIPFLPTVRTRLKKAYEGLTSTYKQLAVTDQGTFALRDGNVALIKSLDKPEDAEVIVDVDDLTVVGPDGKEIKARNANVDVFAVSPDGKHVAASISVEGKSEGNGYVFEVATKKRLADVVPRVYTPLGGNLVWKADSSGFFYTRHPLGDERPHADKNSYQQIYFHKLGTPTEKDEYVFGKGLSRIVGITFDGTSDGKYLLASVVEGTSTEFVHYLQGPSGKWEQITKVEDGITNVSFGPDDSLIMLSVKDAPRGKVLRATLEKPRPADAEVLVPSGEGVLQSVLVADTHFFIVEQRDGGDRLRVFDLRGKEQKPAPVKRNLAVNELVVLDKDVVLYQTEGYTEPPTWHRYDPKTGRNRRTALSTKAEVNFNDVEVVHETAISKDGTKVPLTVLKPKGVERDGKRPTLLTGYGGFGENQKPTFEPDRRVWFDQGGIIAIGHVRGDGHYGVDWQKAGQKANKQNVFDDFAACARCLIDKKYTNRDRLAITGGSNGGLLMGVALTQHPELFKAVVADVGVFDVLRHELHPSGTSDVTEFGTVKDKALFGVMHGYSPYHRVKDGTACPAILIRTGANDGRVNPANSWKMAARLQAATASKLPVLLWTNPNAGHDLVTPEEVIEREAEFWSFLFWQLGVEVKGKPEPGGDRRAFSRFGSEQVQGGP